MIIILRLFQSSKIDLVDATIPYNNIKYSIIKAIAFSIVNNIIISY